MDPESSPLDDVTGREPGGRRAVRVGVCGVDLAVLLMASEHVLLLQGPDDYWRLMSVVLDTGEDLAAAAVRAGEESVGLRLHRSDLALTGLVHCRPPQESPWLSVFFAVAVDRARHGDPAGLVSRRGLRLGWSRLDRLPGDLASDHAAGLALYLRGERYGTLGWEIP